MNISLDKPIAYGRTAEIYAWEKDQVLKLFYDWFSLENIRYELCITRAVHDSGLPVPTVGEIIQVNGRNGLLYQRVDGISMFDKMAIKPWMIFHYARRLAELHVEMHSKTIRADIPLQHPKLKDKINHADALSIDLRAKALDTLETLPVGDRLCHGDFHPGNIILSNGSEVVIDWIDSSLGNPLADVARTTIIARGAIESHQIQEPLQRVAVRIFHAAYLRQYFSLRPAGNAEYRTWLPIVAAARLSENIPEVEGWLLEQVDARFSPFAR